MNNEIEEEERSQERESDRWRKGKKKELKYRRKGGGEIDHEGGKE